MSLANVKIGRGSSVNVDAFPAEAAAVVEKALGVAKASADLAAAQSDSLGARLEAIESGTPSWVNRAMPYLLVGLALVGLGMVVYWKGKS